MTKDREIVYFLIREARHARDMHVNYKDDNEIYRMLLSEHYYTCHNNAETARRILYGVEL